MTGRSPARLLAPLALVTAAVALYAVVTSGTDGGREVDGATPAATQDGGATRTSTTSTKRKRKSPKTYTVQPGDTPSAIAEANDLTTEELLELNPAVDPQALTPGDKLKLER